MNEPHSLASPGPAGGPTPALARLLAEQRKDWQQGTLIRVEHYLQRNPELKLNDDELLDLIYSEILLREENGEPAQREEYLQRFPALAGPLRAQFDVEQAIRGGLAESRSGSVEIQPTLRTPTPASPGASALPNLAGYQILGELGRGGMGVVYKARQIGLDRVVALKMIRDAALAGPEDVARFQAEAQAVARLQHPNIVQVHEIGAWDGRPCFSMEYVEGGNLAQYLHGAPLQPREAATVVETLAHAVHHAHCHGVVHRDLKPGNILLHKPDEDTNHKTHQRHETRKEATRRTPPGSSSSISSVASFPLSVPKITDFGLAKLLHGQLAQTQTGSLLGTPSYMAPEQAEGRTHDVGPLSDVYALGAILYECLTGRPPFRGATLTDTLDQVRSVEPVPVRRLQPKVPRDLETICLKCLEKQPQKRYASADALAEDLGRFREGLPILARPAGLLERTAKWARRRPTVAALVVAGIALLGGAVAFGVREMAAKARDSAAKADRETREIAFLRQDHENFQDALDAVEQMLAEVGDVDLADVPQMETAREKLLQKAMRFYEKFLKNRGTDPRVRLDSGRAYGRVGDIQEMLGRYIESEQAYDRAVGLLTQLADDDPSEPGSRRELARSYHNRGILLKKRGRFEDAQRDLRQAEEFRRRLKDELHEEADAQQELAASRYHLAALFETLGRREAAEEAYRQALETRAALDTRFAGRPEYQRDLARTLNNLGKLLSTGSGGADPATAEKLFLRARDIQRDLVRRYDTSPVYRRELAHTCTNLGALEDARKNRQAAIAHFREARDLLKQLASDFPAVPGYRNELSTVRSNLGVQFLRAGAKGDAEEELRAALSLHDRPGSEASMLPENRQKLASTHRTLGMMLEATGRSGEAEVFYRRALVVQEKLTADFASVPDYQSTRGAMANTLAWVLLRRGEGSEPGQAATLVLSGSSGTPWQTLTALARAQASLTEARECLEAARTFQQAALGSNPKHTRYREFLRNDHALLAHTLLRLGDHRGAALAADGLPAVFPEGEGEYLRAAEFLARCASQAARDGRLSPDQQKDAADGYGRRSVEHLQKAVQQGFRGAGELKRVAAYDSLRQREDFQRLLHDLEGLPKR